MYRVVIIGAGKIGAEFDTPKSDKILTHAHAFLNHPETILGGFCDIVKEKAVHAAAIWGGEAYEQLRDALCCADIVICCAPDQLHGRILKEIAQYRPKLVIAEKPVAVSVGEAAEIQQLYQGKIPMMVNYSRRYIKEYSGLQQKLKEYGSFLKGIGYYGKGLLHNGSHLIDLLQFLMGKAGYLTKAAQEISDLTGDPSVDVTLQIAGGIFSMVAIDSRFVTVFEIELFFERARIRILEGGKRIEYYEVKASDVYKGYYNYHLKQTELVDDSAAMLGLAENAVRFLNGREPIKCTLEDGISVLQLCTEIQRA